jgi:hypothetical protein
MPCRFDAADDVCVVACLCAGCNRTRGGACLKLQEAIAVAGASQSRAERQEGCRGRAPTGKVVHAAGANALHCALNRSGMGARACISRSA